jgi:hypothetical protein
MSAIIQGRGDVFGPAGAVDGHIPQFNGTTGKLLKDGKAAPSGVIVGDTDTQTLSGKTMVEPIIYVAGSTYRPSGVLVSNPNTIITSGSTLEVTSITATIKTGQTKDGDLIRISFHGTQLDASPITRGFILRINGTNVYDLLTAPTSQIHRCFIWSLYRQSSTAIRLTSMQTVDTNIANAETAVLAVNFGVDQSFALSAYQAATGARAQILCAVMEFLPVP